MLRRKATMLGSIAAMHRSIDVVAHKNAAASISAGTLAGILARPPTPPHRTEPCSEVASSRPGRMDEGRGRAHRPPPLRTYAAARGKRATPLPLRILGTSGAVRPTGTHHHAAPASRSPAHLWYPVSMRRRLASGLLTVVLLGCSSQSTPTAPPVVALYGP